MATETLAMSATSTPNNWTLGAGADKVAAVAANDDDTSYINSGGTNGTQQQFAVADPSVLADADTISSVAVRATCKRGGSNNANYIVTVVVGANTTDGATQTSTSAYAQTTDTFATDPAGGPWSKSDVTALEVRIRNAQARDVRCTQLDVVVTFTVADTGRVRQARLALVGVGS